MRRFRKAFEGRPAPLPYRLFHGMHPYRSNRSGIARDNSTQAVLLSEPQPQIGQLVATPGALASLPRAGQAPLDFLSRHVCGGWGDIAEEDRKENAISFKRGLRLVSSYHTSAGARIWVITEADRSATTILLPEEY